MYENEGLSVKNKLTCCICIEVKNRNTKALIVDYMVFKYDLTMTASRGL